MKNYVKTILLTACVMLTTVVMAQTQYSENERYAIREALKDVTSADIWKKIVREEETVGITPLFNDKGDNATSQLKNAITDSGATVVEPNDGIMWDEILTNMTWSVFKSDIFKQDTLTKFGKLLNARYLVYGTVVEVSEKSDYTYVEIELHMSSLETKQHVWGGTFVERYYTGTNKTGIVDLDKEVKGALKEALSEGEAQVKRAPKLKDVEVVGVYSVGGDIDGYTLGLVNDMFSGTKIITKNLGVQTMGEAEWLLRENPETADTILNGAVRELSRKLVKTEVNGKTYEINAEVQLSIETVDGNVLWSSTLSETTEYFEENISPWQKFLMAAEKAFAEKPLQVVLYIVIGLFVLIALGMFFRATKRVR